ncbi:MAG TPA: aldehyde dehydrogenase family protein [Woeseiaceae bacterium]|nr:aldehyde dehydrogenase family protein [Woeseiaceae bacterium]
MYQGRNFVDGHWLAPESRELVDNLNPANSCPVSHYAAASIEDARAALYSAGNSFKHSAWRNDARLRAQVLLRFAERLRAVRDELCTRVVQESGKLAHEARFEIGAAISEAEYYAGLARNLFGRVGRLDPNGTSFLTREPVGVALIVVPWNAPVTLLVRSLAPAMAAGCSCIVKAAGQTAASNDLIIQCLVEIDELPNGIIQSLVEPDSIVGQFLVAAPDVDVVSFTGSTAVGKQIMKSGADTLTRLSLELGGKAPAIVFPDADLADAANTITRCAIVLAGQMCTAISRALVHVDVLDEMRSLLLERLKAVRVGPGDDPASQMGPLINRGSQQRALNFLDTVHSQGEILLKGTVLEAPHADGAFVTPSLIATNSTECELVQRELFAPILALESFSSEEQAIAKANATRFGLAASLYTRDTGHALHLAQEIKAGTVWINTHNKLFAEAETGGYRESGIGRLHGVGGLDDFLETKHIYLPSRGS